MIGKVFDVSGVPVYKWVRAIGETLPEPRAPSRLQDMVDEVLKEVCLDIAKRYQVKFLEIGTDKDHVHF